MARNSSYKGSVVLPAGLLPKNNANFPLVDAHEVQVEEDGTRLDDKIDSLDSKTTFAASITNENKNSTTVAPSIKAVNDAIEDAVGDIDIDTELSASSTNPVQNKVVAQALSGIQNTLQYDTTPTANSDKLIKSGNIKTALDAKQDTLTFDNAPTFSSTNPVTSGGIKTALDAKQDTLSFDSSPTADSINPVTSGGVKTALDAKQDTLSFDTAPVTGSIHPVTSVGIKNAIDAAANANLGAMQAQYDTFVANAEDVLDNAASLSNGMVACNNIAAETTPGDTRLLIYTGTTNATYTNGHWYYNSAASNVAPVWTDGGAVGTAPTIDNTLSVSGAAAEASAVGDAIDDIVIVSDTEPSATGNKVWIKETTDEEVVVPLFEEHIAKGNKADITTNNEDDLTSASKAYAIGDHFYINDTNVNSQTYGASTLYKATAAIAAGDPITVGTNCIAVQLADEVTELSNNFYENIKLYQYGYLSTTGSRIEVTPSTMYTVAPCYSDYLMSLSGKLYINHFNQTNSYQLKIATYDEDFTIINVYTYNYSSSYYTFEFNYSNNNNVKYIRISIRTYDLPYNIILSYPNNYKHNNLYLNSIVNNYEKIPAFFITGIPGRSGVKIASVSAEMMYIYKLPIKSNTLYKIIRPFVSSMYIFTYNSSDIISNNAYITDTNVIYDDNSRKTLYIKSGKNDTWMYIQMYKNSDTNGKLLQYTDYFINNLIIIEDDYIDYCDISKCTKYQSAYINTGRIKNLEVGSYRLISIPIKQNTIYKICNKFGTYFRVGTSNQSQAVVGTVLNNLKTKSNNDDYIYIINGNDTYLYLQFYIDADSNIISNLNGGEINSSNLLNYFISNTNIYECGPNTTINNSWKSSFITEINHRGFHTAAPENTLPAFKLSKQNGYDWVETDVQFTNDGVPVLLHDASINRTARNADGSTIETTININDITYDQALEYDFGIFKGDYFAGTKIMKFEDFIVFCKNIGLNAVIELKTDTINSTNVSNLIDIVNYYRMNDHVQWLSTSLSLLQTCANIVHDQYIGYVGASSASDSTINSLKALQINNNKIRISMDIVDSDEARTNYRKIMDENIQICFRGNSESAVLSAPIYADLFITNGIHPAQILYNESIN